MTPERPPTAAGRLHHHLIEHFLARGHAPKIDAIASRLGMTADDATAALLELEEQHGVVLHGRGAEGAGGKRLAPEVWLVHPFSATPTLFWVSCAAGGWWAPCVWCAFGIATLADVDVTISTRLGGETENVDIEVRATQLLAAGLVAHFSVPIARAWDDVHRSCSTTLVFRSADDVRLWCDRHGVEPGSVLPLDRVWALARAWYGGHRSPAWRKHSRAEAKAIFESVGLTDPFWSLSSGAERF